MRLKLEKIDEEEFERQRALIMRARKIKSVHKIKKSNIITPVKDQHRQ